MPMIRNGLVSMPVNGSCVVAVLGSTLAAAVNGRDWGDVVVGVSLAAAATGCSVVDVVEVVEVVEGVTSGRRVVVVVDVVVVVQLHAATMLEGVVDVVVTADAAHAAPPAVAPTRTSAMIELTIVASRFIAALFLVRGFPPAPRGAHNSPCRSSRSAPAVMQGNDGDG
jgi:hypothetical protein